MPAIRVAMRLPVRVGAAVALALLLAKAAPVHSAEDEAPPPGTITETERTEQAPSTAPERKPSTPPAERAPSPEVFVPSEDISEDLSVRFPVDI